MTSSVIRSSEPLRVRMAETRAMPDVVENDFSGLLVPRTNPQAIEQAVLHLIASPALRERLGQAARQTMTRYTSERSAFLIEKFFRHLVAAEGRRTA